MERIAVIGAGSWGTTAAALAAGSTPTVLWSRRPEVAESVNRAHRNPVYLPDHVLPDGLHATTDLLEAVAPGFAASVRPGDLIVAGKNFGCGSAMEVAVTVIQAAGIRAVIARSFARSFFRNAINNGLVVVECDTSVVGEGDRLSIGLEASGAVTVRDVTRGQTVAGGPIPPVVRELLEHGGLVPYLVAHGGWGEV